MFSTFLNCNWWFCILKGQNRCAWEPNYSPSLRALTQQRFPSHSNVWERPPSLSCTIWYFRLHFRLGTSVQEARGETSNQERVCHCLYTVRQFLLTFHWPKQLTWPHCSSTRGWKKRGGHPTETQYSSKKSQWNHTKIFKKLSNQTLLIKAYTHRNYRQLINADNKFCLWLMTTKATI